MGRCYICNSPFHYSESCPKRSAGGSNITHAAAVSTCYLCGKPGHKKDRCPSAAVAVAAAKLVVPKITAKLEFSGMWGEKSALVAPETTFHTLKMQIITEISNELGIVEDMLDKRNQTPHIDIQGSQRGYDILNGATFIIDLNTFTIERNLISIPLGLGAHYTILYWNSIGEHRETVHKVIARVLTNINRDKGGKDEVEYGDCVICMEAKSTVVCMPCRHMYSCIACAAHIKVCAVCRTYISDKIDVIIC